MISKARLRRLARELDVRLGYAEKNYVNSWILWAIYTSSYGDSLLFKGGTALSKLYFPESPTFRRRKIDRAMAIGQCDDYALDWLFYKLYPKSVTNLSRLSRNSPIRY